MSDDLSGDELRAKLQESILLEHGARKAEDWETQGRYMADVMRLRRELSQRLELAPNETSVMGRVQP